MRIRIRRIRQRRWRRLFDLQRLRRDERGIQLVEAAIVVPIFLVLFAATAELDGTSTSIRRWQRRRGEELDT